VLEDGSKLATLRNAIAHLAELISKAERNMPEILTASDLLTNAAEHGGPVEVRPHCYPAGDQSVRGARLQSRRARTRTGNVYLTSLAPLVAGHITGGGLQLERWPAISY
jgi:hypothetical protein